MSHPRNASPQLLFSSQIAVTKVLQTESALVVSLKWLLTRRVAEGRGQQPKGRDDW
jgi:hypothetical protein